MWEEIFNLIASIIVSLLYVMFIVIISGPLIIATILWALIYGVRLF